MEQPTANYRHTNILSLGGCSSHPVSSGVGAIAKGKGVVIFAVYGAPQTFNSCNRRFGCTGRYYVNWAAEKFLSLRGLSN